MFLHPHSSKPASRSSLPATRPQAPFSDFHAAPLLQVHWLSRGYWRCSGLPSTPTCARLRARPWMDGGKRMRASSLERDADCTQADFPDSVGRAEMGWPGCSFLREGRKALQAPEGCANTRVKQTRRLAGAWPTPAFALTLHLFPASLHLLVLLLQLERTLSLLSP